MYLFIHIYLWNIFFPTLLVEMMFIVIFYIPGGYAHNSVQESIKLTPFAECQYVTLKVQWKKSYNPSIIPTILSLPPPQKNEKKKIATFKNNPKPLSATKVAQDHHQPQPQKNHPKSPFVLVLRLQWLDANVLDQLLEVPSMTPKDEAKWGHLASSSEKINEVEISWDCFLLELVGTGC